MDTPDQLFGFVWLFCQQLLQRHLHRLRLQHDQTLRGGIEIDYAGSAALAPRMPGRPILIRSINAAGGAPPSNLATG